MVCLPHALDALVAAEHEARAIWAYVEQLDESELYAGPRSVEGHAGRAIADRRVYLALWLYATAQGVGSARRLEQLCVESLPYRWLCGGVPVNYHTLAEFRTAHGAYLDKLLTRSVAALMHEGLVSLAEVAHDGLRVRAGAGSSSFRRRARLEERLAQAEAQVARLKAEAQADPSSCRARQEAARRRAAEDRVRRVRRALQRVAELAGQRRGARRESARASTTDADATVMKMADGGFRPACNVRLSAATDARIITAVEVVAVGADYGQLAGAVAQHVQRYGQRPAAVLVDGGYAKKEEIERLAREGTVVYAPVRKAIREGQDPRPPRPGDTPAVAEWRRRMATAEAQAIYRRRAATIECVNALARNRGLCRFTARGLAKARAVVLWHAVVHHLPRARSLRARLAGTAG